MEGNEEMTRAIAPEKMVIADRERPQTESRGRTDVGRELHHKEGSESSLAIKIVNDRKRYPLPVEPR